MKRFFMLILSVLFLSSCTKNLSTIDTANCYIVSKGGKYCFNASVKGNSDEVILNGEYAEVLWESFGTNKTPKRGELIKLVSYDDGYIYFTVPNLFKKGNAVIAVKDDSGEILWSWHIWLTDEPREQVYYNNAGTMMDRNLGAIMGDNGYDRGTLYAWGRKDPFLSSSAMSTAEFPNGKMTSQERGTIEYSIENPMTYIYDGDYEYSINDGHWEWRRSKDLWGSYKTMYDPCPVGWRVPDASVWIESLQLAKHRERIYGNKYAEFYDTITDIWHSDAQLYQLYRSYQDNSIWYPMGTYWSVDNNLTLQLYGDGASITFKLPSEMSQIRCQKESSL